MICDNIRLLIDIIKVNMYKPMFNCMYLCVYMCMFISFVILTPCSFSVYSPFPEIQNMQDFIFPSSQYHHDMVLS
jgi:hypothetical protein